MRIVFMGTPEIASACLEAILEEGFNVVGVITAPDKPAGRGRKIQHSSVKQCALQHDLYLMQPPRLKDPAFLNQLQALKPDVQVVVAFRMLPRQVWDLPPQGTFNMHASLLPQYRGAAPINWALINGETQTGVTTFFLNEEIDTGSIILRKEIPILPDDNAGTLHDKLKVEGARLVIQTLEGILNDQLNPIDQKQLTAHEQALKSAPKIFREDCRINWQMNARQITNLIRGLSPVPGAFTELEMTDGDPFFMKIFEAIPCIEKHTLEPGKLLTDNKKFIKISTKDGFVDVKIMQAAGKKRMKTEEFLRGYSFS